MLLFLCRIHWAKRKYFKRRKLLLRFYIVIDTFEIDFFKLQKYFCDIRKSQFFECKTACISFLILFYWKEDWMWVKIKETFLIFQAKYRTMLTNIFVDKISFSSFIFTLIKRLVFSLCILFNEKKIFELSLYSIRVS